MGTQYNNHRNCNVQSITGAQDMRKMREHLALSVDQLRCWGRVSCQAGSFCLTTGASRRGLRTAKRHTARPTTNSSPVCMTSNWSEDGAINCPVKFDVKCSSIPERMLRFEAR